MSRRRRISLRLLRVSLRALAALAIVLLVIVGVAALILALPAGRQRVLDTALPRIEAALPGTLEIGRAAWPTLSRLEIDDLVWTDGADSLASVDRVVLALRVRELLRRDVHVERLEIEGVRADVPAVLARFPAAEPAPTEPPDPGEVGDPVFPRAGSFPGVPSIALDRFRLSVDDVRLDEQTGGETRARGLRAVVEASLDLRAGQVPSLRLERLEAHDPELGYVDSGRLTVDLARAVLDADIRGQAADVPFFVRAATDADHRFELTVVQNEEDLSAGEPGVHMEGVFEGDVPQTDGALQVDRVTFTTTVVLPELDRLRAIPLLESSLAATNELPLRTVPRLAARGSLTLRPELAGTIDVEVSWDEVLRRLAARVTLSPAGFAAEDIELTGDGVELTGRWSVLEQRHQGAVDLRVWDTGWLAPWLQAEQRPETVRTRLRMTAEGPPDALALRLDASGAAAMAGAQLDSFVLAVGGTLSESDAVTFDVAARTQGIWVRTHGEARGRDVVTVDLPPIVVSSAAALPPRSTSSVGVARYEAATGEASVTKLRLQGDAGELELNGRYVPAGESSARVSMRWPRPPVLLVERLELAPEVSQALAEAWSGSEMFLTGDATLDASGEAPRWKASASFSLPGPQQCVPLLPEGMELADLGPLVGSLTAASRVAAGGGAGWNATLDIAPTTWIDTGRVDARGDEGSTAVDSLRLDLLGLELVAGAVLRGDSVSALARFDFDDPSTLSRFAATLPEGLAFGTAGEVRVAGTTQQPDVQLSLAAQASADGFDVPGLVANARMERARLTNVRVATRGRARFGTIELDELTATVRGVPDAAAGSPLFPAWVAVEARGPNLSLLQASLVEQDDAWHVRTDTLSVSWMQRDLRSLRPFDISFEPQTQAARVSGLELAGSMGSLTVEGTSAVDGASLRAVVQLTDLPPLPGVTVPPGLWPASIDAQLTVAAPDSVVLSADVRGLGLGSRGSLAARVRVAGHADGTRARAVVEDAAGEMIVVRAQIPAHVGAQLPWLEIEDGPLDAMVRLVDVPLPLRAGDPAALEAFLSGTSEEPAPRLQGSLLARGTARDPVAAASLSVTFEELPRLAQHHLDAMALIIPRAGVERVDELVQAMRSELTPRQQAALQSLAPPRGTASGAAGKAAGTPTDTSTADTTAGPGPGVHARWQWTQPQANDTPWLEGDAFAPLALDPQRQTLALDEQRALRVSTTATDIALRDLGALLPRNVELRGLLSLDLQAEGSPQELDLQGNLDARGVRVTLPDGSLAQAKARLHVAGTSKSPEVTGAIEVERARLLIPEPPRSLHPTQGDALLWSSGLSTDTPTTVDAATSADAATAVAAATSADAPASAVVPTATGAATSPDPAAVSAKVGVDVTIPSAFWIRGRGLEVELAGDLQVVVENEQPQLTGQLQALRGSFEFMGREFLISRGVATFYGGNTIDPELDLMLTLERNNTQFFANVTGPSRQPKVALTSEPSMDEMDILSQLLFASDTSQLDNEQTGHLQSRAVSALQGLAIPRLQARLAKELGLDVLELQQGKTEEEGRSVVIGRYLSPRALLKYEQDLENGRAFGVNLEYWLMRRLKVDTHVNQESPSGIDLNWSKDY